MGLYDEGIANYLLKWRVPLTVLVVVIVALLFLWFIDFSSLLPAANPLSLAFSKSKVAPNESALLYVTLNNTLGHDLNSITINAKAIDEKSLEVFPKTRFVDTLGLNETRVLEFSVMAKKEAVNGSYSVEITALIEGKTSSQRINLEIG